NDYSNANNFHLRSSYHLNLSNDETSAFTLIKATDAYSYLKKTIYL
ncbi:MAG: hypothetical protein ACI9ES_002875, partial [Oceanospirillaceae bacterium]